MDPEMIEFNRIKQVAKENGGVYRWEPILPPEDKKEKAMTRKIIPVELVEALEGYLERHPNKAKVEICSSTGCIKMSDMPNEIRQGTKIGIDYEKALYKMAFEDLIDGRKQL